MKNSNEFDIKSIGYNDFNGDLTHNVSAHAKVNPKTGEFYAFGYSLSKPVVHYTLFNWFRDATNRMEIPITSIRMIHDFPITEHYVIIPDLPLEMKPDKIMRGEGGSVF